MGKFRKKEARNLHQNAEEHDAVKFTDETWTANHMYDATNQTSCTLNHSSLSSGKSFVEMVKYIFTMPDVKSFLSQRICQDPLENFFGRQRQRGGVHDHPNAKQFTENTQAIRVINMIKFNTVKRGNCRGTKRTRDEVSVKENSAPLPKRPRSRKSTAKPLGLY